MLDNVAKWLILISALNWGLIGAFGFNLVGSILSGTLLRIVYVLVGLSGVYSIMK